MNRMRWALIFVVLAGLSFSLLKNECPAKVQVPQPKPPQVELLAALITELRAGEFSTEWIKKFPTVSWRFLQIESTKFAGDWVPSSETETCGVRWFPDFSPVEGGVVNEMVVVRVDYWEVPQVWHRPWHGHLWLNLSVYTLRNGVPWLELPSLSIKYHAAKVNGQWKLSELSSGF